MPPERSYRASLWFEIIDLTGNTFKKLGVHFSYNNGITFSSLLKQGIYFSFVEF